MKTHKELEELAQAVHEDIAAARSRDARVKLDELQNEVVQPYKDLGTVYVPPDDWDYMGMGGPPDIGDYQKINLDDPWLFDSPCYED